MVVGPTDKGKGMGISISNNKADLLNLGVTVRMVWIGRGFE